MNTRKTKQQREMEKMDNNAKVFESLLVIASVIGFILLILKISGD